MKVFFIALAASVTLGILVSRELQKVREAQSR